MPTRLTVSFALACLLAGHLAAGEEPVVADTFLAQWPTGNQVPKGMAVRVAPRTWMLYDLDLLRVAAGWDDDSVAPRWADNPSLAVNGRQRFATATAPGVGIDGDFSDGREEPFGPLPRERARYLGHHRHGERAVLSYRVGDAGVLEEPGAAMLGDEPVFLRTLAIAPSARPLAFTVCAVDGATARLDGVVAVLDGAPPPADYAAATKYGKVPRPKVAKGAPLAAPCTAVALAGAGAVLRAERGGVRLEVPAHAGELLLRLAIWNGAAERRAAFTAWAAEAAAPEHPRRLCARNPVAEPATTTAGARGTGDAAYVLDTLTLPLPHQQLRTSGLDFLPDGRLAVCDALGSVWLVDGIDDALATLRWRRIASGLFQPLGLKVVDGVIHVACRDAIVRLRDLDSDGTPDLVETACDEFRTTPNFHEFVFGLEADAAGNLYCAKAGPVANGGRGFQTITAHHGCLLRIPKGGDRLEVVATGLRAPNGIGMGPDGQLTTGDNEGSWIPKCRINWVEPGGFYGCLPLAHRTPAPTANPPPLCWLPKNVDSSSGQQVWVTSQRWGPLQGDLLHLSFGTAALCKVLIDPTPGIKQGGVVRFPLTFRMGAMRARFSPVDGQLYVCGLGPWQTKAVENGGLQRVRFTGKPPRLPRTLRVERDGVRIGFTDPLDPASAADTANWTAEQWNYEWTASYGSKDIGRAPLAVAAVTVEDGGRTAVVRLGPLKPVHQLRLACKLKAADGAPVEHEIHLTINRVPE